MDASIPCTIRKLNPGDAPAWAQLRLEALETYPLAFSSCVPEAFNALVETAIERLAVHEDSAFFGAYIDNALVGTVGILRDHGAKERHKCLLVSMFVSSGNRRTGVGALLVKTAIQQARSWNGVEQILLVVNDVAPEAKRLYEKMGFRTWGIEPRSLRHDGLSTDSTHMILELRAGATKSEEVPI